MSTTTPSPAPPGARTRPTPAPSSPASSRFNVGIDPVRLLRQNWLWLAIAGVLGIVLGVGAHFALLRFAPTFTASAYWEVKGVIRDSDETSTTIGVGEDEVERYQMTQVERMQSDEVLRQAAQANAIRNETQWKDRFISAGGQYDPVEAYLSLRNIVTVRPLPETNYIVLSVSAGDRSDSATIARAISDVYRQQLRDERQRGQLDVEQTLTNQLNAIQEERLLIEDRMRRLLRENSVESLDENLSTERLMIEQLMPVLTETRYQLENYREQLASYEEQLRAPGGATYPEIVRSTVREHQIIQGFESRIADLKASRRAALENLGPNNRAVKRLDRAIDSTEAEMRSKRQDLLEETFTQIIEGTRQQVRQLETVEAESLEKIEEANQKQAELQAILEDYSTLSADLERLADREQELESRISEARAIADRRDFQRVDLVQPAQQPEEPSFPKLILVVPAVTVLVLGFTGGIIFLRELLEQRVRGPADLSLIPRLRLAGVIPDLSEDPARPPSMETAVLDRPKGVVTEAFRLLRADLLKRVGAGGHKTVLVVGGMPGSGATSVLTNLAFSCVSCDLRTLVIDANLRRPSVHEHTHVQAGPGLAELLAGEASFEDAVQHSESTGLDVISAGGEDRRHPERLITETLRTTLDEAGRRYDLVLIDVSPAIVASDAMTLASRCDATLMVVRAYGEKRGLVSRLRGQLEETSPAFLGVVINGVRSSAGGYFRKNFLETHRYSFGSDRAARRDRSVDRDKGEAGRSPADNGQPEYGDETSRERA